MSTTQTRPPRTPGRSASNRFALVALAAIIAGSLPLPLSSLGIVAAVAAVVLGIRAAVVLVQEHARGLLVGWTIVGVVLMSMVAVLLTAVYALYPVHKERQDCLAGAGTQQAQAECNLRYEQELDRLVPGGRSILSR